MYTGQGQFNQWLNGKEKYAPLPKLSLLVQIGG